MAKTTFRFNAWDPEIDARVEEILAQMSLEEKVGQLEDAFIVVD